MHRIATSCYRRRQLLAAACTLALVPGCSWYRGAGASFVQTGQLRAPLPEDAPVRVFLTGPPGERYEEIGVVEVSDWHLAWRVELAQAEARQRGGNAVVALGSWIQVDQSTSSKTVETKDRDGKVIATQSVPVTTTSSTPFQIFMVVRLLDKPLAARAGDGR